MQQLSMEVMQICPLKTFGIVINVYSYHICFVKQAPGPVSCKQLKDEQRDRFLVIRH